MRNGHKVYDADTHISPCAETLEPFLSAQVRELVPDLDARKVPIKIGLAGEIRREPYQHNYRFRDGGGEGWGGGAVRVLGEGEPRNHPRHFQNFQGTRFPTEGGIDISDIRVRDMDEEGVDVQFMVPNGANGHPDVEVEMEFLRAQHRYLDAFCSYAPHRLKSAIVASSRDIPGSVQEIKRWGKSSWAVAVHPQFPLDYPLDHPDMDAIWAAACEQDLAVVHHSFASGYPGYRDLWSSPFIGRTASHPWGAMRAVASVFCSGIMDRFPELRYAVLESGFGWLPFWAKRMDDQVGYIGYVADIKQTPSEYMTSGRFFASIVLHEGPEMVAMVNQMLGEGVLMFGSDYPHAESRFPESVDKVLGWENLTDEALRTLLWDNPVRLFGEP